VTSLSATLLTIMTKISEAGCEPSKIILLSAYGSLQFVLFSLPRPGKGLGTLAKAFLAGDL
jgi:hypothetical protein